MTAQNVTTLPKITSAERIKFIYDEPSRLSNGSADQAARHDSAFAAFTVVGRILFG